VVYFTLHAGLSATQVGLGLSAAGGAGLVAAVVLGVIADRMSRRRLLSLLFLALAVGFGSYALVHNVVEFFVTWCSLASSTTG
jgi:predicted MFS family arabinose efflux permease